MFPSAALFIAALWGVGQWRILEWQDPNLLGHGSVFTWKGAFAVYWTPIFRNDWPTPPSAVFSIRGNGYGELPNSQCWWPRFKSYLWGGGIRVPLWMLFVLTAAPSAAIVRTAVRERSARRLGLCTPCGYDRTGLATAAPCPECGHAP